MKIQTAIDLVLLIFMIGMGAFMAGHCLNIIQEHQKSQTTKDKSLVVEFGDNTPTEFKYNTSDLTLMLLIQDIGCPVKAMKVQINDNPEFVMDRNWQMDRLSKTKKVYQSQIAPYVKSDIDMTYTTDGALLWKVKID